MSEIAGLYSYWVVIVLMMAGLYIMIARYNLIKKIIGLGLFQTSIFYLYITIGKVTGGTAPILVKDQELVFSNPLPHVLILTAIVVGVATTAVALALVIRIYEEYGTIEEDEIKALENAEPEA
ncbi:MAG: cation:proton antiporter subunit C [Granulosicoccus sp.]